MDDVADLLMPKLGLTMTEGTIARWVAERGRRFAAGDVIVIVETDKIASEVEAPSAGELVSRLSAEGEVVPVGAPIAKWRLEAGALRTAKAADEAHAPESVAVSPAPPAAIVRATTPADATRTIATPYARRLAREAALDLSLVAGSGPRGRIKAADVLRVRQSKPAAKLIVAASAAMQRAASRENAAAAVQSFATADVDVSALRALDARLGGVRDRPFERKAYVALACIRTLDADGAESIRLGFPVDGGIAPLEGNARDTLSAVAARLAHLEPQESTGDVAIFIVEGKVRLYVPGLPEGWRMAIGIGGVRAVRGGDATHEMTVSLVYDAGTVDHHRAAERLSQIAALLEEPLHLLAV